MTKRYREPSLLIVLILFLTIAATSCGSSRQGTTRGADPVGETVTTPQIDESFDPVLLQDEDLEFPEKTIPRQQAEMPVLPVEVPENEEAEPNRVVGGFRVQIFATQNIENATLQKKEAEFVFVSDSVSIYIEFDSPMYKIRVGDCLNRADAENLRETARPFLDSRKQRNILEDLFRGH